MTVQTAPAVSPSAPRRPDTAAPSSPTADAALPGTRRLDRAAGLVLLAFAGVALATFRDYGLGWDDFTHAQMGDKWLALYASGLRDTEAFSFVNLYLYGGGFDMLAALTAKLLPLPLFEARRLVGAAVGLIGLALTWRLARRVGGPRAGLIALLALALCPVFYGHIFFNAKDAPFAAAMALLLLGCARAFAHYPRPRPADVALVGLGLGLLLGTRIIGVIAALYALPALALLVAAEARAQGVAAAARGLGRFAATLAPALALGYVVMGLVWPWGVAAPLNPLRALEYFSVFFEKPWRELFDGTLILVPDMPRRYLPTLLALQLPEIMLALGFTGALLAAARMLRPALPPPARAINLILLLAAFLPVAIVVATRPAMYNGFRHFLFVLPPFAVLAGLGGAWLWAQAERRGRAALAAAAALAALGLALPAVEIARLHPLEYTYFNRLAGGVPGAEGRFMLDYWGLSFKEAAARLKAHLADTGETPPAGRWKIAVCGPHPSAQVALGSQFDLTWDPRGADFALMLGVYYCLHFPAPVVARVTREGVTYARVYDIRGRSFPTLLTRPPP